MIVWVAEYGDYENHGVGGVYATAEAAMEVHQTPARSEPYRWSQDKHGVWRNGLHLDSTVTITPYEVEGRAPDAETPAQKIAALPVRMEYLGGQRTGYLQRDSVMALLGDPELARAPETPPADGIRVIPIDTASLPANPFDILTNPPTLAGPETPPAETPPMCFCLHERYLHRKSDGRCAIALCDCAEFRPLTPKPVVVAPRAPAPPPQPDDLLINVHIRLRVNNEALLVPSYSMTMEPESAMAHWKEWPRQREHVVGRELLAFLSFVCEREGIEIATGRAFGPASPEGQP